MTTQVAATSTPVVAGRATPYVVAGAALAATVALRWRDPHASGSWGLCPLRFLTGFDCPFCGGLRAVNDLTHARLGEAAASNLFFVTSIPVLVVLWLWWARAERATPRFKAALAVWAVVGVVFTVYRNTPWGHALWA